jgi:biotin synthase
VQDTSTGRGFDMHACRKMLCESGFSRLLTGDGTTIPLDLRYLLQTA